MSAITSFLVSLGPWNWFILAAALFCLEFVVPGVHFLWFGVAAIVAGALALTIGFGWQFQLIAFAIAAVTSVFLVRRYARDELQRSPRTGLNQGGEHYVGRTLVLEVAISGGRGRVRVGDTLWQAEGPDLPAGSRVRVTGTNGTVLVVERATG